MLLSQLSVLPWEYKGYYCGFELCSHVYLFHMSRMEEICISHFFSLPSVWCETTCISRKQVVQVIICQSQSQRLRYRVCQLLGVTESRLSFDFDVLFHSLGWLCSLVIHLDRPRDLENTQRGSILVISLSRETHLLSSSTTWLVFSLWQNPLCYKSPTNSNKNC